MGPQATGETISLSSAAWSASDAATFAGLQARLKELWPTMTTRTLERAIRTVIVVPSGSLDLPAHWAPVLASYEERYLFIVLLLAYQPGSIVIYQASQPILPRLVDYYVGLVP